MGVIATETDQNMKLMNGNMMMDGDLIVDGTTAATMVKTSMAGIEDDRVGTEDDGAGTEDDGAGTEDNGDGTEDKGMVGTSLGTSHPLLYTLLFGRPFIH